ncbi:hypothetical protein LCGC14_3116970, partial [marine sediment metagenome]
MVVSINVFTKSFDIVYKKIDVVFIN